MQQIRHWVQNCLQIYSEFMNGVCMSVEGDALDFQCPERGWKGQTSVVQHLAVLVTVWYLYTAPTKRLLKIFISCSHHVESLSNAFCYLLKKFDRNTVPDIFQYFLQDVIHEQNYLSNSHNYFNKQFL